MGGIPSAMSNGISSFEEDAGGYSKKDILRCGTSFQGGRINHDNNSGPRKRVQEARTIFNFLF